MRTPIAEDLELHTSTVRAAGQTFFEVRQYIPSLKQYGRGVTIQPDHAAEVVLGLEKARLEDHNARMDEHMDNARRARAAKR